MKSSSLYRSLLFYEEISFAIFCFFTVTAKVEDTRPLKRPPRRPRKPKTLNNPEDSTYYTLIHVSLASYCGLKLPDNSHLKILFNCLVLVFISDAAWELCPAKTSNLKPGLKLVRCSYSAWSPKLGQYLLLYLNVSTFIICLSSICTFNT